jgi:diguanylate cyclase (GGDEF)-like protein/PAS domain S-box-containing protein
MEIDSRTWPANVLDLLLDAVIMVDLAGRIVQISAASERIFGYTPSEMVGRSMIDFVYAEDRARTMAEAKLVIAGVPRIGFENRYVRKDGRPVHIMWSAMLSATDKVRIGVARDVTEGKLARDVTEGKLARIRQSATYAISQTFQAGADLESAFDEAARIVSEVIPIGEFRISTTDWATGQATLAFPLDSSEFCSSAQQGTHEALSAHTACGAPMPEVSAFRIELPLAHAGRQLGVLRVSKATAYSTEDIEFLAFISEQLAVAIERKMLNDDLLRAARYDELTGLPNRRLFYDRLRSAMARARRKGSMLAILYLDVDDFKAVNDTLGHAAGDAVLSLLAERLRGCIRESDTVARLGGDEFLVLIEDVQSSTVANAVAAKIGAALDAEMALGGSMALVSGVSIGMAFYPGDGEDEDALLAHADKEMYIVKRAGSP